jgi:hypothetical protein
MIAAGLTFSISFLCGMVIQILVFAAQAAQWLISNVAMLLLARISPADHQAALAEMEEEARQLEIKLMAKVIKIRDHAKETEDWTEDHSAAIAAIATALVESCGWDEMAAHRYMKDVVDKIPGLEYQIPDEDDEDDPFADIPGFDEE